MWITLCITYTTRFLHNPAVENPDYKGFNIFAVKRQKQMPGIGFYEFHYYQSVSLLPYIYGIHRVLRVRTF